MCNDNKLRHLHQQGFTLVELMVSLVIFIIIMLGLLKGEIAALTTQSRNLYRDQALSLAEDELSRLKGELYTSGTTPSSALDPRVWSEPDCTATPDSCLKVKMRSGEVGFVRTTQITDISVGGIDMKRIDVAVGWTQGTSSTVLAPTNRNNQATLSTIIVRAN